MWLMEFISTKYFQSWFKINYPCLNEYFTHSLQVWLDIIWGLKAWEHITQVSSGHRIANTIGSDYLVLCSVRPYFPFPFCLVLFSFLLLTPTSSTSCKNTHQSQNSATWISPKHCDKIITETKSKAFLQHKLVTRLVPWFGDLYSSIRVRVCTIRKQISVIHHWLYVLGQKVTVTMTRFIMLRWESIKTLLPPELSELIKSAINTVQRHLQFLNSAGLYSLSLNS